MGPSYSLLAGRGFARHFVLLLAAALSCISAAHAQNARPTKHRLMPSPETVAYGY